jgi:hypothetical protein
MNEYLSNKRLGQNLHYEGNNLLTLKEFTSRAAHDRWDAKVRVTKRLDTTHKRAVFSEFINQ